MSNEDCLQQGECFCNLDYLMVNLGRNEATTMRLVGIFLENYPLLTQRMHASLECGDYPVLRDVLHDIRSSCVLFSGQHCVDLARGFEDAVRRHLDQGDGFVSPDEWKATADSLADCMRGMAAEMTQFLADRQN